MTIKIRHAGTSVKYLVTMINKQHISAVPFINSKPNKRNIPSLLILQAIIGGAWSLFINPLSKHRLISLSRKYILVTQPVCIKIYLICVTCVLYKRVFLPPCSGRWCGGNCHVTFRLIVVGSWCVPAQYTHHSPRLIGS